MSLDAWELALEFGLVGNVPTVRCLETAGDLREEMKPIDDVLDAGVVGDLVERVAQKLLSEGDHGRPGWSSEQVVAQRAKTLVIECQH